MQTVALEQAQATLPELLHKIAGGEEFTITQNGEPKAKLSAVSVQTHIQAKVGSLEGKIWMSSDFDAPSDDFKEYLQ
jgi:antitoxin (DNA-binding transcriptional repressor) of toxin-antitoxin stability system